MFLESDYLNSYEKEIVRRIKNYLYSKKGINHNDCPDTLEEIYEAGLLPILLKPAKTKGDVIYDLLKGGDKDHPLISKFVDAFIDSDSYSGIVFNAPQYDKFMVLHDYLIPSYKGYGFWVCENNKEFFIEPLKILLDKIFADK